jgi:hypothetical protein
MTEMAEFLVPLDWLKSVDEVRAWESDQEWSDDVSRLAQE